MLVGMAAMLATSHIGTSTRVYGLSAYAALAVALVAAVMLDRRRTRKRGHFTLTSTPRLRVVPATRKRVDGFLAICDPVTIGRMDWTADDAAKLAAQFQSGHREASLVLERRTTRVIGCVISKRVHNSLLLLGWIGPEYRRQGYGSELLDRLCTDAFAAGCRSVMLGLPAADPDLVPFVEQRQFIATGTQKIVSLHDAFLNTLSYRRMAPGFEPKEQST